MNKMRLFFTIGLTLLLVVSLSCITLAQERSFKGSYTASYKIESRHSYDIGSKKFTNVRSFSRGDGSFTPLGPCKIMGSGIWVWDNSMATLRDEVSIAADSNDKVYARVTGTQSGDVFRGTFIIWGGTGPYVSASGTGTVSGKLTTTSDDGSISATFDGTIIYPPQPQPPDAPQPPPAAANGVNGEPAPHLVPRTLIPTYDPTTPWKHLASRMIVEKDVPIPTRDGLRLAGDVYRPARRGQFPVVLTYTTFAKDYNWQQGYPGWDAAYEPWIASTMDTAPFEAPDPAFWVPLGYAVVIVDPRGVSRSPGTRKSDSWDAYDAVQWAGAQEWSNGSVGTSGVSALGGFQLGLAALNPPALKAIAPWEGAGVGNWRQGGVERTLEIGRMLAVPHKPAWDPPAMERADDLNKKPWYEQYADIKAPMLVGGSWSSHGLLTEPAFNQWRFVGSTKWLYTHGREKWAPYYQTEYLAELQMFFDHFLKGTDDRILKTPKVRIETRDTRYTWRVRWEDNFPIPGTEYRKMYMDASEGKLKNALPAKEGSLSYVATTAESAKFDYTFKEEAELTGYMKVKVWLAPEDHNDADVFVTLRKFDTAGREVFFAGYCTPEYYPIGNSPLRLSNRELDPKLTAEYYPNLKLASGGTATVKPGQIVPLEIAILPTSTLFHPGETLRVEVSGIYRPGDNLTYTYPAMKRGETPYFWHILNKGKHTVHTGGKYDSFLLMPVVPRKLP